MSSSTELFDLIKDEGKRQVTDFGIGLFHAAVERPINGIVQISNHALSTELPELHIVDGDAAGRSVGGFLGNIGGTALNFYALNKISAPLLANIGGATIGGAALRMGLTGAVYEGILTPSDPNSSSFLRDRVSSALVGATTFATMGATAYGLNKVGVFAAPELRSLAGSIVYGATSAMPAGIAHAEANALFKQGQFIPNGEDLAMDVGSMALFGAAYGAVGYGYHKLTRPEPIRIESGTNKITLQTDRSGKVVSFAAETDAPTTPDKRVFWNGKLMADGSWTDNAYANRGSAGPPGVSSISLDGHKVTVIDYSGHERVFTQGKPYESWFTRLQEAAKQPGYDGVEAQLAVDYFKWLWSA